jgi:hypothetical protein
MATRGPRPTCSRHPHQYLICPVCRSSRGGKATAELHAKQLSKWGSMGGRPRKHPKGAKRVRKAKPQAEQAKPEETSPDGN